jgi:hypothetical protein
MSQPHKPVKVNFLSQWWSIQVIGAIALAVTSQAAVSLPLLLMRIDNPIAISMVRIAAYLLVGATLGYFQWYMLKQVIKNLDRRWIYTAIAGLPINILNWALIQLGIDNFMLDEEGTVLFILAIIGAVVGGFNGWAIGTWQKMLFKKSLYWRSLWHDWDRDHILAGALSGTIASVVLVSSVIFCGGNWLSSPIFGFICSIGLSCVSQVMYGIIVGDTIHDVFKQAKLIQ